MYVYMNSYHSLHGFTKLPTTLNSYCLLLRGKWLLSVSYAAFITIGAWWVYCYVPQIHTLQHTSSHILGSLTIASFAYIHHIPDPSLLLILPMQNNKSVKTPLSRDVRKIQYSGWGFMSNTARGKAECCICYSTPPLILYFLYIIRNGAWTYINRSSY